MPKFISRTMRDSRRSLKTRRTQTIAADFVTHALGEVMLALDEIEVPTTQNEYCGFFSSKCASVSPTFVRTLV